MTHVSVEPEYENFCVKQIVYGKDSYHLKITITTKTLIVTENGLRFRRPVRVKDGAYLTKTGSHEFGYLYKLEKLP